ncbi:hypothetical protein ABZP36_028646 [Zizania latifolia]
MSGTHGVGGGSNDSLGASSSNGASPGSTLVPDVVNLGMGVSPSSTRVLPSVVSPGVEDIAAEGSHQQRCGV